MRSSPVKYRREPNWPSIVGRVHPLHVESPSFQRVQAPYVTKCNTQRGRPDSRCIEYLAVAAYRALSCPRDACVAAAVILIRTRGRQEDRLRRTLRSAWARISGPIAQSADTSTGLAGTPAPLVHQALAACDLGFDRVLRQLPEAILQRLGIRLLGRLGGGGLADRFAVPGERVWKAVVLVERWAVRRELRKRDVHLDAAGHAQAARPFGGFVDRGQRILKRGIVGLDDAAADRQALGIHEAQ